MPKRGNVHQSARVLVIDDDEIALEAIREVLVNAGYEVHCLASPIGATQVIVNLGMRGRGRGPQHARDAWRPLHFAPAQLGIESAYLTHGVALGLFRRNAGKRGCEHAWRTDGDQRQHAARPATGAGASGWRRRRRQAASNRRAAELNHDERRIIASAAKEGLTALLDKVSDKRGELGPLALTRPRLARERIQRSGLPQLSKASLKLVELVERCAARRQAPPEMRLAARGALELIANLEEPNTAAPNLPALTAMHTARLERALEELSK